MARRRFGTIVALGTAQTLAWGSSYYLPAILTDPSDGPVTGLTADEEKDVLAAWHARTRGGGQGRLAA